MATGKFLVKRDNGQVEVNKDTDLLNSEQLSFLAAIASTPENRTFILNAGRIFIDNNIAIDIADTIIDMGPSGTFETAAINSSWFNKAYFTIDKTGTIKKYEGIAASSIVGIKDPVIVDNEMPICEVIYQDDGSAGAGTIFPILQDYIYDKRDWLNLGNIENTAFKLIYNDASTFIIQSGSAWFNNHYLTLASNFTKTATVSPDANYYVYLDYNNASGGISSSSFTIVTNPPESGLINLRRYIPLGTYSVFSGEIQKSSFTSYKSKTWQYRDSPYLSEETQISPLGGTSTFTLSNFTFITDDPISIDINGIIAHEGVTKDFTRTLPNIINFNYNVVQNAELTFRKL